MNYLFVITSIIINCFFVTLVSSQSVNENMSWFNSNQKSEGLPEGSLVYSMPVKYQLPTNAVNLRSTLKNDHGWLYDQSSFGKRSGSSDELPPPPNFIGSRGRRTESGLNEIDVRSTLIAKMAKNMGISPSLLLDRLRQNENKKKDLLPYKDAFMGSRG